MARPRNYAVKPQGYVSPYFRIKVAKRHPTPRKCRRCGKPTATPKHSLCADCKKILGKWV